MIFNSVREYIKDRKEGDTLVPHLFQRLTAMSDTFHDQPVKEPEAPLYYKKLADLLARVGDGPLVDLPVYKDWEEFALGLIVKYGTIPVTNIHSYAIKVLREKCKPQTSSSNASTPT